MASETPRQRILNRMRRVVRAFEAERTEDSATWKFSVRVAPDELDGGWVAQCLDLPGCFAQGDTEQEALHNMSDAIAGVISARMDANLSSVVPEQDSDGGVVRHVLLSA